MSERIVSKIRDFVGDSSAVKTRLIRVANLLRNQIILNIRRRGLIDTGNLLNSIRYEFYNSGDTQGVLVGSFGVPYAAVHEFGFNGVVTIKPFQRLQTMSFGRPIQPRRVAVSSHSRKMNIKPKRYIRDAVDSQKLNIIDIMRGK